MEDILDPCIDLFCMALGVIGHVKKKGLACESIYRYNILDDE